MEVVEVGGGVEWGGVAQGVTLNPPIFPKKDDGVLGNPSPFPLPFRSKSSAGVACTSRQWLPEALPENHQILDRVLDRFWDGFWMVLRGISSSFSNKLVINNIDL